MAYLLQYWEWFLCSCVDVVLSEGNKLGDVVVDERQPNTFRECKRWYKGRKEEEQITSI